MSTTPGANAVAADDSGTGVQPLPKGAMQTLPGFAFHPPPSPEPADRPSPPATPSQRLLNTESSHVQFASYLGTDEKVQPLLQDDDPLPRGWVPPPLRGWYAICLILLLVCLAIVLEVALHLTNKNSGWKTHGDLTNVTGVMHYVYTLPPVIVAAVIVALWTWTDLEIKKMQPYVDLARGDSPPHKSLLLDYTRSNNFVVWTHALYNKHWVVTAASVMVLVTLVFQPLASALLTVKNTWIPVPDVTVKTFSTVGLNQSQEFDDLTVFLTASGFASASVGYALQQPPFVSVPYTITPFEIPTEVANNGTILANVTAIRSDTNCVSAPVTMTNHTDGSGWTNTVSQSGCTLEWIVDHRATTLFGTSTPDCNNTTPPQFLPVVFWFFTYTPSAKSSATMCSPTIALVDAEVTVDIASRNVTNVHELRPFNASTSNFGSLSGNLTGAPLNGHAYNGINFTLASPDAFIIARMNATQLTMPAAVFQAAVQSVQGVEGSFDADLFVEWSNTVYVIYLSLIAKAVYFLQNEEQVTLQIKTFQLRLWMSSLAVHLLAAAFFLLAIAASFIHIFHRWERRNLYLQHQPGTIASAVSIGAETGMGHLVATQRDEAGIKQVLADKKFRIDPSTNKIVMVGEDTYDVGSPTDRRFSVFEAIQGRRASRRYSRRPDSLGPPGRLPDSPGRLPDSPGRLPPQSP